MKLTIDFETRSRASLTKCGPHVYAEHPSTQVICMAVKVDNTPAGIWIPNYFLHKIEALHSHKVNRIVSPKQDLLYGMPLFPASRVRSLIYIADTIEAHNAFFEKCIYYTRLHDWPKILEHKWRCSAAKAAAFSLPRGLDDACQVLNLPIRKDKQGSFVMHKLCKPNNKGQWNENPEDLLALFRYCIQDVEAEYGLSEALRDLSSRELKIWQVDQRINARGLHVDTTAAANAISMIESYKVKLKAEFLDITKTVGSPTQVAKYLEWLKSKDLVLKDLTKDTVSKALEKELPLDVKRSLEIRQALSKSSTAKFKAMVIGASTDNRMRDILMYQGAGPGRWAGKRIQPHNMPRKMPDNFEEIVDGLYDGMTDYEVFSMLYGDPMKTLSGCVRGFICAAPGKELTCADYSSIEGRGLAWVAEEEYIIQNYYDGKCAYCVFASQIHGINYQVIKDGHEADIKKFSDMRFEGKTGELACGYQGGEAAIARFAPDMPKKRRQEIVSLWRDNRPKTKQFWRDIEELAVCAVTTGLTYTHQNGLIKYGMSKDFLHCRLPSGRIISYFHPRIVETTLFAYEVTTVEKNKETGELEATVSVEYSKKDNLKHKRLPKKDFTRPTIRFWGVDSETKKWVEQDTYGGKLTENIVQGIAGDILSEALIRFDEHGKYPVVLHVHDEVIAEVPKGTGDIEEFIKIMTTVPSWAVGFPIAANGFITRRYHK